MKTRKTTEVLQGQTRAPASSVSGYMRPSACTPFQPRGGRKPVDDSWRICQPGTGGHKAFAGMNSSQLLEVVTKVLS
jgi:hypothetical protein